MLSAMVAFLAGVYDLGIYLRKMQIDTVQESFTILSIGTGAPDCRSIKREPPLVRVSKKGGLEQ
jgi:hypothetical protein